MSMLGHNRGPSMDRRRAWRRHAWTKARADLLPKLPIEVVRLRVRRARELGLDYKAYASIRAASGHDVVALLFSTNALRVGPGAPAVTGARSDKIALIRHADPRALVHRPLTPEAFHRANAVFDAAAAAPLFTDSWSQMRAAIARLTTGRGTPGDRVVLIGDTGFEREWCAAGRLAGYIPADDYFKRAT